MSEKDDRALEAMAKGSKTGIIGHGSSGVSEELRKRLSELQKQKDDVLVTPYIQEIASLRAQLEQAQAEAGALRSALDSVYPLIAGRVLQLQEAGEVRAMEQWNAECIKIIQALSSKGGRP